MQKKILAFLTAAMCFAGVVPVNATAEVKGLQEAGGSSLISGEQSVGVYEGYYYKLSDISETAEADTAKLIIDESYSSDTVSSSCTIKSLGRELTIDAGNNDIIVLLDEAVLEKTITVKADKGSVTFFIQGSLVCGKESKGIVWHEICDGCKITYDKYMPICFYGTEDSVITLNDEAILCGSLRLPYTVLDDRSSGAFKIEYISEYDNIPTFMKPSIIGNVLLKKLVNAEKTAFAYCGGKAETGDVSEIKDIAVFEEGEMMTLDDVVELSKKGNALTLNDFAKFKGVIAGSGIFILEYDLGKGYTLMVGSVALDKIDYARLRYTGSEKYIDIRTDDVEAFIAEMNAKNDPTVLKGTETLTLDIVKELSKKGSALDWKDFEAYKGRDIGSGLYIWQFELEDGFKLLVGGVTGRTPEYIVLMRGDEKTIDIRTDDVEEFIETAPKKISYRIVKAPDKVVYRTGERIDLTGIQVEVTVGSGEPVIYTYPDVAFDYQSDIPKSPSVVLSTNFRSDIAGTYKVKVVDADNVSFDVEVVNDEETSSSTAMVTVLEINNDIMLLKPAEGSGLMRSSDRLTMGTQVLGSDITPAVGMKLKISYSDILETYPAMFGRIDKVAAVQDENGFIRGDANCDEQVDMADAVLIMQALANPDRYGRNGKDNRYITELGVLNGDMDGNGLTVGDAQAIQLKLLGLDKEDSQSITSSMIANKLFRYEKSTDFGVYAISTQRNGSYLCIEGDFDAPRDTGTWKVSENTVVLTGQFGTNRFRYEDGTLIYIAEGSDGFDIKPKDGEKFYSLFDNSGISFTQPKLSDIVTIKTDYNPAMSNWSGIGILLEFASPEYDISLEAADGHFVDWDIKAGSGPISNEGKSCDIGKNGYTFWASDSFGYPDGYETEITVNGKSGGRQIELGKIYITQVNGMTFEASLEKPNSSAVAGKKFVYEKEGFGGDCYIDFKEDGTFLYSPGYLSSYLGGGTWEISGDRVILTQENDGMSGKRVNCFRIVGNELIYIEEDSDSFIGTTVKDGEKFYVKTELDEIRQQLSDFFAAEKIDYTVVPKDKMPEQFADKYVFIEVNTADTDYAARYGEFLKDSGIDRSLIKSIPYRTDSDTELNKIRALLYCYILENNINASVDPTDEEEDLKNKTVLVKYADSSGTRAQLEKFLKEKNIDLDLVEFLAVE